MANGDAGDAITLRIVWVAVATVTATRPRGGRSHEGEILVRTRPFAAVRLLGMTQALSNPAPIARYPWYTLIDPSHLPSYGQASLDL